MGRDQLATVEQSLADSISNTDCFFGDPFEPNVAFSLCTKSAELTSPFHFSEAPSPGNAVDLLIRRVV